MASQSDIVESESLAPVVLEEATLRNGIASSLITGIEIADHTIFAKQLVVGEQTYITSLVWTATDIDTASWASGTITLANGNIYSIDAGNTGNITVTTYIYFDPTVSKTVLQTTTTYANSLGQNKILLAIVQKGATGSECIIEVLKGLGTTIDGNKIATGSITATQIAASTITATQIAASTITAAKLNITTLSAITADLGTITAGNITGITVTGSTIRTASSGERVQFESNIIGSTDGLVFYDSGGFGSYFYITSGGDFELEGGDVLVESNLRVNSTVWSEGSNLYLKDNNGHTVVWCDGSDDSINVSKFYLDGWELTMTAPKTAIVDTSDGYKALYCTESPEVWFMDFCDTKDTVDPMFLEVTEGDMKFIKLDDKGYQVWRRRKGMANLRFENKTKEEFMKNNQFWSGQKLKRKVNIPDDELSDIEKKIYKYRDDHMEEVLKRVEDENIKTNKKVIIKEVAFRM